MFSTETRDRVFQLYASRNDYDALEGVEVHAERMRRRLVVPAAGLLVGPTPVGALVLVK